MHAKLVEAAAGEEARYAALVEVHDQSTFGLAEAAAHRQSSPPESARAPAVSEELRLVSRQGRAEVPSSRLSIGKDRTRHHERTLPQQAGLAEELLACPLMALTWAALAAEAEEGPLSEHSLSEAAEERVLKPEYLRPL